MRFLGAIVVTFVLLAVPEVVRAQVTPSAARLTTSASFSGLRVDRVRLYPHLSSFEVPPRLVPAAAPSWVDRLAAARPELTLRTQLGTSTSDEHRMRRFDGLNGHSRAQIFECPVHADLVLFRIIGVFDAL